MGIALTGGRKASIIGLPLAWNAGGIGVKEPALIGYAAEPRSKRLGSPNAPVSRRIG
jgi:hypothetical protein